MLEIFLYLQLVIFRFRFMSIFIFSTLIISVIFLVILGSWYNIQGPFLLHIVMLISTNYLLLRVLYLQSLVSLFLLFEKQVLYQQLLTLQLEFIWEFNIRASYTTQGTYKYSGIVKNMQLFKIINSINNSALC